MAAVYTWTGQTVGTDVVCIVGYKFGFYGSSFNDAIEVGEYQDSTHVENDSNVDQCTGDHVRNTKWLTAGTVSIDGGGTETLGAAVPADAECPLELNFTYDNSVATSSAKFWAYDGTTDTVAPVDLDFMCGERPDTAWTQAEGSAAALDITDDTAATSHDFFIYMSVKPTAAGVLTEFTLKFQLTYQ